MICNSKNNQYTNQIELYRYGDTVSCCDMKTTIGYINSEQLYHKIYIHVLIIFY